MADEVTDRFQIAQDGNPSTEGQLSLQKSVREEITLVASLLVANTRPSREQSLALTKLEEALMWAGKAIFKP